MVLRFTFLCHVSEGRVNVDSFIFYVLLPNTWQKWPTSNTIVVVTKLFDYRVVTKWGRTFVLFSGIILHLHKKYHFKCIWLQTKINKGIREITNILTKITNHFKFRLHRNQNRWMKQKNLQPNKTFRIFLLLWRCIT